VHATPEIQPQIHRRCIDGPQPAGRRRRQVQRHGITLAKLVLQGVGRLELGIGIAKAQQDAAEKAEKAQEEAAQKIEKAQQASQEKLEKAQEDAREKLVVAVDQLAGKGVVLNFWASWCGPCRRELPSIVKLHEEFKDKGLVILGVNDEDKGTAKSFAGKAGLTFPTLDDSSQKLHRQYRVNSIPTIFLIDREGKIVRFLKGSRDEESLRKVLQTVGF